MTGSIAAYKACELASRLVEFGAHVTAVLTRSARELVGAATLEAVTGRRVITELFGPCQSGEIEHIAVAQRAHLFLIAPATANILAKAAHGLADDWLSTSLLATTAPVLFAPAMNAAMYAHPATQANIRVLRRRGCRFVGPEEGRLACGGEGPGRMSDPATLLDAALPLVSAQKDMAGKRVVITSGGSREPLDPVRFLGNRSSGRMGRALACAALARGASVAVVGGPAEVALPYGAEVIAVETAREMAEAAIPLARQADIVIGAAAVADYRVDAPAPDKHKRDGKPRTVTLIENEDIIAQIGAAKRDGQVIVGFAAETQDVLENAADKLKRKNLDLIVANEVGAPDSGFGTETLKAAFVDTRGAGEELPLLTKEELAWRLFNRIREFLEKAEAVE